MYMTNSSHGSGDVSCYATRHISCCRHRTIIARQCSLALLLMPTVIRTAAAAAAAVASRRQHINYTFPRRRPMSSTHRRAAAVGQSTATTVDDERAQKNDGRSQYDTDQKYGQRRRQTVTSQR